MINAHTHVAASWFRGLGHAQPPPAGGQTLIERLMFPTERALTEPLVEAFSYSYLFGALRSGTTCVCDHYYFASGVARACERLGMRAVVGETVADLGGAFPGAERWQDARAAIERWPHGPLVRPAVCPHAADTVSRALLTEMAEYARRHSLPLHMHLSQSDGERERVLAREGVTPVEYARDCGALGERSLVAHLVTADESDLRIVAASGATAALCPASQILYERLAPIAAMWRLGVPLAVATDCAVSDDGADLLGELKLAGLLLRHEGAAPRPLPEQLLGLVTATPARVLGLPSGALAVGAAADLVLLRRDPSTEPIHSLAANLVYSLNPQHVRAVMIAGEWVLWDGEPQRLGAREMMAMIADATVELEQRIARAG
jgi:5-methylthioadenosine/S-adenosylhomocysteine deaminase